MHKRKRWIYILVFSLLLIVCVLWRQNEEKIMKEEKRKVDELKGKDDDTKILDSSGVQLATKEFLIKTFDVTEEDIIKYEVEEVITEFGLTEDYFMNIKDYFMIPSDIVRIFAKLQEDLHAPEAEKYEFTYLYKAKEYTGEFPDIETICYLAASNYVGDAGTSFVIDFKSNKIYYGYGISSVSKNIHWAEGVVDITEIEREEIIGALKEAEVHKWDYSYVNKKERSGEVFWDFGMEFDDGTIISFNGKGDTADSYPEFRDVIFGISKEHQR